MNHVRRRLVSLSAGQGQVRFVTQPKSMTMRATSTRQPELDLSLHSMPVPPSVRATLATEDRDSGQNRASGRTAAWRDTSASRVVLHATLLP